MYTPEDIQHCFDAATLQYLQRKHTGGNSGQKGTRYEDYFAVYKLAQLAPGIVEQGLIVYFASQLLAFVDDLIIDVPTQPLQHYQLKNSTTISWTGGSHPIKDDFAKQYTLNQSIHSRESRLFLVVSDQSLSAKLPKSMPPDIQAFSQVVYFPYKSSIVDLAAQVSEFYSALVYLSAFETPEPDKIEFVAQALLGAWLTISSNPISGHDLLTQAQSQTPHYIRSFQLDFALDQDVEKILSSIEDFKYNLAKGFLHWDYADGLQTGTPPFSIDTEEFRRLQERIKDCRPATFEELEKLL